MPLADREDGGNLVIDPPRPVWERSVLSVAELTAWSWLVAATGEAMLKVLPQLAGGCINYWEAGNWALNPAAEPVGPKTGPEHRNVHMHLIGRSRMPSSPDHAWGEAPRFPSFADRLAWASGHSRFSAQECLAIVEATDGLLRGKFAMAGLEGWKACEHCGHPSALQSGHGCA